MQRHPLSAAFPTMSAEEQYALTNDIDQHGQREPITVHNGMVLDGWHRYQACQMLEIPCLEQELDEDSDPVAFVLSCNMHRRHLTGSQRAAAIVSCSEWAKVGKPCNGEVTSPLATVPQMAKQAEVSERTIQHAKRAVEAGLGDKVRDGELSASAAAKSISNADVPQVNDIEDAVIVPDITDYPTVTVSKASMDEQHALMDEMIAEQVAFEKILDADDKLAEAVATIKAQLSTISTLKGQLYGVNEKNNELIRLLKSERKRADALQKECDRLKMEALPL